MMFIMWFSGKLKITVWRTGKNVLFFSLCGLLWEELIFHLWTKTHLNICTVLKPKCNKYVLFPLCARALCSGDPH